MYNLPASQRAKIIPTVSSEYSFFEIFGFEGMIDFGEELVKWQSNKNCLKVGEGLSKQRCIFTTNTRFVHILNTVGYRKSLTGSGYQLAHIKLPNIEIQFSTLPELQN